MQVSLDTCMYDEGKPLPGMEILRTLVHTYRGGGIVSGALGETQHPICGANRPLQTPASI